ncbi:MAG: hypothetical protein ACRC41_17105 [Sarcina sp.]
MDQLEILMNAIKNIYSKKELNVIAKLEAFSGEKQTMKIAKELSKGNGILKIKLDSEIDTKYMKCVHKLDNETNIDLICSRVKGSTSCSCEACNTGNKFLEFFRKTVDLSIALSLISNMDLKSEGDKLEIDVDLKGVALELIEDEFECFNEDANDTIVNVSKAIIREISSENYEKISLKGFIDNEVLKLLTIEGIGISKFNLEVKFN